MTSVSFEMTNINLTLQAQLREAQAKLEKAEAKIQQQQSSFKLMHEKVKPFVVGQDSIKYLNLLPNAFACCADLAKEFEKITIKQTEPPHALSLKATLLEQDRRIQELQKSQLRSLQETLSQSKEENDNLRQLLENQRIKGQELERRLLESMNSINSGQSSVEHALEQHSEASRELTLSVNQNQQTQVRNNEELLSAVKNQLIEERETTSHSLEQIFREISELRKEMTSSLSTGNRRGSRGFIESPFSN